MQINEFVSFTSAIKFKPRQDSIINEKWEAIAIYLISSYMESIRKTCTERVAYVGHVKGILDLKHGYIKLGCVDLQGNILVDKQFRESDVSDWVKFSFNSIIFGITVEEMKSIYDIALDKTIEKYGLERNNSSDNYYEINFLN